MLRAFVWMALLVPGAVLAQPPTRPLWVIERTEHARWTYQAEFSPRALEQVRHTFLIDSVTAIGTLHLRFGTTGQLTQGDVLRFDAGGRAFDAIVIPVPRPSPPRPIGDTLTQLAWRYLPGRPVLNGALQLPQAALHELAQVAGLRGRGVGNRWVDSVSWAVEVGAFRQEMRGLRHRSIVRDSIVDGQRHVIVRDSVQLTQNETGWIREFSLDSLTRLTRVASGVAISSALVDPASGFLRQRADTLALKGEATLHYADGRSYGAPVRLDLTRQWDGMTADAHDVRLRERREVARRSAPSMVVVPTPMQRRLRAGDAGLRDSLLSLVRANPRDTANLARISELRFVRDSGEQLADRLLGDRTAAGDTSLLVELLTQHAPRGPRYSRQEMQTIVGLIDRPDRLLAHGLVADDLLAPMIPNIVWNLPAMGGATPACTPEACEALAAARDTTHHPRTRDLALVMGALVDPRRYADSVLARARAESSPFRELLPLIRGTGATWPAAAGRPLPPQRASWRLWVDWAQAPNPAYPTYPSTSALPASPIPSGPRFEDSHRRALRYQQLLTGRDFEAEFRTAYAQSTSDSARLIFGTMLLGIGAMRRGWDELARELQTGSPAAVSLARAEVLARLSYPPMTGEKAETSAPYAADLEDAVLTSMTGGAMPGWADIAERFAPAPTRPQPSVRDTGRTYVFDLERTSTAIIDRWRDRIGTITPAAWEELPGTVSTTRIRSAGATRYGPFYRLTVSMDDLQSPRNGFPAMRYAASTSLVVMRWNNRWWVISNSTSVT